ncbi:enhanced serine sensitivity protein SseB [Paenibacillus sp. M1]|uniref:Enhanced serine sensitivity protein SseB n=1 Tax=Paenibacillus haidiansis TaxID=1574488 RepID=A0ABU7VSE8_9BACL
MDEARKDEIGRRFLLSSELPLDECRELEIQELIFLIDSAKHFKEQGTFDGEQLEQRKKAFYDLLKEKVINAKSLYIAYDKNTNYPYMDAEDRIWMFSKKKYAAHARDYFMQQLLMLDMKRVAGDDILKAFAELHSLGIPKIIIDNGQYHIEIDRDEILPPPDFSGTPEISIPVTNPDLQRALIRFFQTAYTQNNFEGKQQVLQELEDQMIDEVVRAKYLLPMQLKEQEPAPPDEQGKKTLKEGTVIQFAVLGGEGETTWLPVFTDWTEFEKAFDKSVWSSNIVSYDDVLRISENMDGIIINSRGIPLTIDDKNKERIEAYRRESGESKAEAVKEVTVEKDTQVLLGEPKVYPAEMINAVKSYMKTEKRIKKAYLRLMIKDGEMSYLIIVDLDGGDEKEIFNAISAAATPHLNGMILYMMGIEDWADQVQEVEPFYKKKRFGLF